VHGDVEVGNVRVSSFVEKDIIRLEVAVDDLLLMKEGDSAGEFSHVESYGFLIEGAQSFEVNCNLV
jgi:hypothetical protein